MRFPPTALRPRLANPAPCAGLSRPGADGTFDDTALHFAPRSLAGMAMLGLALALGGCASNPTGGMDFVLMSKASELRIGKEEHEKLMQTAQVYQDEALAAYVDQVGQRLAAISHAPELQYHFTVIDSADINAFALPGGYVYINRGLLTLLSSEDQLAAVLGHEIGHITARHAVQQQTAGRTANIVSAAATVASVVTTGTSVLGETANLFGGALVSGYGREMELEADGLGAQYLRKAGYDPNAMVQVIEVLKNHEDFMKKTSNRAPAYHGLFASHPRNDTRLQQAVAEAESVTSVGTVNVDPALFREKTSGLVVGPSPQNVAGALGRNRYYQTLLGYTLVFPEGWGLEETPTTVTATAPAQGAALKVEALRLQQMVEPRVFIRERLGIAELRQTETLAQFGLRGFTGLDPDTGARIAVIYYGPRAFVFTGTGQGNGAEDAQLTAIRSFRPIARNEGIFANPIQIFWLQADGQVRYADLAGRSRIPGFAEEMLRLMNGDYPAGEPQAGEWIKITD